MQGRQQKLILGKGQTIGTDGAFPARSLGRWGGTRVPVYVGRFPKELKEEGKREGLEAAGTRS